MSVLTHNAVRTRELIDDLQRKGFPAVKLLADAGVRPQQLDGDDPVLPFEKIAMIWEDAAEMTGDDLVGFRRVQVQDMRQGSGPIDLVAVAAPS